MKHTTLAILTIAATFAFAGPASARHDDSAHGYNKARATAITQAQAAKPVYIGVGPRAQDSPLRYVTAKSLRQSKTQVTSTPR
jgi:hypothetical protein